MELTMTFRMVIYISVIQDCSSLGSPYYKWPLVPGMSHSEVEHGYSQGMTGCSLNEAEPHPDLDYNSLQLLGNEVSFVDLKVATKDVVEFNDFSIALFFSAELQYEGTLIHYQQDASYVHTSSHFFKELKMTMNGTNTIIEMTGPNGESYVRTVLPSLSVLNLQWVPFAFSFDKGKSELTMLTTAASHSTTIINVNDVLMGQPGTIRVGGDFYDPNKSFNGRVTCIQLFASKFNENDFSSAIDKCLVTHWKFVPATPVPVPSGSCPDSSGHFAIVANDAIPSSSAIGFTSTSSKIKCGGFCLKADNCISFTINKFMSVCKIYSVRFASNLMADVGTDFYVKRTVCC